MIIIIIIITITITITIPITITTKVIWAFWRVGRFPEAYTLFVRIFSDGRHPEHGNQSRFGCTCT